MNSFHYIWALLAPQGEFVRRRLACQKLWDSFPIDKQRCIYQTIRRKKAAGEFVNDNPYFAIQDNSEPPKPQILSYQEYYIRYGTTEDTDGWERQFLPEQQKTIYVKQPT